METPKPTHRQVATPSSSVVAPGLGSSLHERIRLKKEQQRLARSNTTPTSKSTADFPKSPSYDLEVKSFYASIADKPAFTLDWPERESPPKPTNPDAMKSPTTSTTTTASSKITQSSQRRLTAPIKQARPQQQQQPKQQQQQQQQQQHQPQRQKQPTPPLQQQTRHSPPPSSNKYLATPATKYQTRLKQPTSIKHASGTPNPISTFVKPSLLRERSWTLPTTAIKGPVFGEPHIRNGNILMDATDNATQKKWRNSLRESPEFPSLSPVHSPLTSPHVQRKSPNATATTNRTNILAQPKRTPSPNQTTVDSTNTSGNSEQHWLNSLRKSPEEPQPLPSMRHGRGIPGLDAVYGGASVNTHTHTTPPKKRAVSGKSPASPSSSGELDGLGSPAEFGNTFTKNEMKETLRQSGIFEGGINLADLDVTDTEDENDIVGSLPRPMSSSPKDESMVPLRHPVSLANRSKWSNSILEFEGLERLLAEEVDDTRPHDDAMDTSLDLQMEAEINADDVLTVLNASADSTTSAFGRVHGHEREGVARAAKKIDSFLVGARLSGADVNNNNNNNNNSNNNNNNYSEQNRHHHNNSSNNNSSSNNNNNNQNNNNNNARSSINNHHSIGARDATDDESVLNTSTTSHTSTSSILPKGDISSLILRFSNPTTNTESSTNTATSPPTKLKTPRQSQTTPIVQRSPTKKIQPPTKSTSPTKNTHPPTIKPKPATNNGIRFNSPTINNESSTDTPMSPPIKLKTRRQSPTKSTSPTKKVLTTKLSPTKNIRPSTIKSTPAPNNGIRFDNPTINTESSTDTPMSPPKNLTTPRQSPTKSTSPTKKVLPTKLSPTKNIRPPTIKSTPATSNGIRFSNPTINTESSTDGTLVSPLPQDDDVATPMPRSVRFSNPNVNNSHNNNNHNNNNNNNNNNNHNNNNTDGPTGGGAMDARARSRARHSLGRMSTTSNSARGSDGGSGRTSPAPNPVIRVRRRVSQDQGSRDIPLYVNFTVRTTTV